MLQCHVGLMAAVAVCLFATCLSSSIPAPALIPLHIDDLHAFNALSFALNRASWRDCNATRDPCFVCSSNTEDHGVFCSTIQLNTTVLRNNLRTIHTTYQRRITRLRFINLGIVGFIPELALRSFDYLVEANFSTTLSLPFANLLLPPQPASCVSNMDPRMCNASGVLSCDFGHLAPLCALPPPPPPSIENDDGTLKGGMLALVIVVSTVCGLILIMVLSYFFNNTSTTTTTPPPPKRRPPPPSSSSTKQRKPSVFASMMMAAGRNQRANTTNDAQWEERLDSGGRPFWVSAKTGAMTLHPPSSRSLGQQLMMEEEERARSASHNSTRSRQSSKKKSAKLGGGPPPNYPPTGGFGSQVDNPLFSSSSSAGNHLQYQQY